MFLIVSIFFYCTIWLSIQIAIYFLLFYLFYHVIGYIIYYIYFFSYTICAFDLLFPMLSVLLLNRVHFYFEFSCVTHSYLPQLMAMKEFMISFSRVFLRGATTCNSFETGISSCTHCLRLTTLDSIVTPSFTLHIDRHSCVSKDYSSIPINFQLP